MVWLRPSHQIDTIAEVGPCLKRYYPEEMVKSMLKHCNVNPGGEDEQKKAMRFMGRALKGKQVYLPVRVIHRALAQAVIRYRPPTRLEGFVLSNPPAIHLLTTPARLHTPRQRSGNPVAPRALSH
jgi:hypothetical protein